MTPARHSTPSAHTSSISGYVYASAGVLALLVLGNIFYSVKAIQTGFKVDGLEKEKASLLKEKHLLTEQITQKRSLSEVSSYALSNNFVTITEAVAIQLPSDTTVALR